MLWFRSDAKKEVPAMRIDTYGQQLEVTPALRDYVDPRVRSAR